MLEYCDLDPVTQEYLDLDTEARLKLTEGALVNLLRIVDRVTCGLDAIDERILDRIRPIAEAILEAAEIERQTAG